MPATHSGSGSAVSLTQRLNQSPIPVDSIHLKCFYASGIHKNDGAIKAVELSPDPNMLPILVEHRGSVVICKQDDHYLIQQSACIAPFAKITVELSDFQIDDSRYWRANTCLHYSRDRYLRPVFCKAGMKCDGCGKDAAIRVIVYTPGSTNQNMIYLCETCLETPVIIEKPTGNYICRFCDKRKPDRLVYSSGGFAVRAHADCLVRWSQIAIPQLTKEDLQQWQQYKLPLDAVTQEPQ